MFLEDILQFNLGRNNFIVNISLSTFFVINADENVITPFNRIILFSKSLTFHVFSVGFIACQQFNGFLFFEDNYMVSTN